MRYVTITVRIDGKERIVKVRGRKNKDSVVAEAQYGVRRAIELYPEEFK